MTRYSTAISRFALVLLLAPVSLAWSGDRQNTTPAKVSPFACCKKAEPIPPTPKQDVSSKPDAPQSVTFDGPKDLPPCVDATKFASAFDKAFPGVTAIRVVGPRSVLFLLDGKPPDKGGQPKETPDLNTQIEAVLKKLEISCPASGVTYYVYPVSGRSDLGAKAPLSPAALSQMQKAIPGVKDVIPLADGRFVFVIENASENGAPTGTRNLNLVKRQIRELVDDEYGDLTGSFVIPLPAGMKDAEQVAKAINGRAHNAAVIASDDSHLLITPAASDQDPDKRHEEVQNLVNGLAAPPNGYPAPVMSQITRLFYFRDSAKAASAITGVLPDIKAVAVGSDAIMLSAAIPEAGGSQHLDRDALQRARRILAQLDQPHAQVSLYAWSLQLSDKESVHARSDDDSDARLQLVNSIGAQFNDLVSSSVGAGWGYLRSQVEMAPASFDPVFTGYLRGQVGFAGGPGEFQTTVTYCCGEAIEASRTNLRYGLGFDKLFSDLSPNLMNLLLIVAASNNPLTTANCLIDRMEGRGSTCSSEPMAAPDTKKWTSACQAHDQGAYNAPQRDPHFQMECTRELLTRLFGASKGETNPELGRFRAAIADFLFQYKSMIEYPDYFDPYLEPYSASRLDTQLVEFVDAFESDLAVLNYTLRDRVANALSNYKKKGTSYDYSGIVSVKVVAGQEALVESKAQNYFPATPPNTLADFAKALSTAESSEPKIVAGNLPADAATLGLAALAQVTPPKQTVSIGRELDMTVTPYTLSAANGAELDIEITAKDNGASVVAANSTGSGSSPDDLSSRIAAHHVKSHVRLQSLKLFEISSMDSALARGKEPWKPFDPYLEIPIVADLVRRPRHPDLIRQRGKVFISAVVIPTAADLAATPIDEDYFAGQAGAGHTVHSLGGVSANLPDLVSRYHASVLRCLAATSTNSEGNASGCDQQKLDRFFAEAR